MDHSRRLHELDSRSVERRLKDGPILIVPFGALEAHGPHLPLGSDQFQAEATADALAERLDALVAPTIPYGSCVGARRFPGTLSLSTKVLADLTEEVVREYVRNGFTRLLLLTGHAERGHVAALREGAGRAATAHPDAKVLVLSDYEFVYELKGQHAPATDGHAGLLETSRVLAIRPELVGPERPRGENRLSPYSPRSPTAEEWPESVIGDSRPATAQVGAAAQDHVLRRIEEIARSQLAR